MTEWSRVAGLGPAPCFFLSFVLPLFSVLFFFPHMSINCLGWGDRFSLSVLIHFFFSFCSSSPISASLCSFLLLFFPYESISLSFPSALLPLLAHLFALLPPSVFPSALLPLREHLFVLSFCSPSPISASLCSFLHSILLLFFPYECISSLFSLTHSFLLVSFLGIIAC